MYIESKILLLLYLANNAMHKQSFHLLFCQLSKCESRLKISIITVDKSSSGHYEG